MNALRKFRDHFGGSPLSLLVMLATFALGGFAAWTLIGERPIAVIIWFVIALIGHDLVFLPLYAIVDRAAGFAADHARTPVPWINYVRFPAVVSGVLLLLFLPAIGAFSTNTVTYLTGLSTTGYLATWLMLTGALFLLSAVCYAIAMLRAGRRRRQPST